MNRISW